MKYLSALQLFIMFSLNQSWGAIALESKIEKPILDIAHSLKISDVAEIASGNILHRYLLSENIALGNFYLIEINQRTYFLTSSLHHASLNRMNEALMKNLNAANLNATLLQAGRFEMKMGADNAIEEFEMYNDSSSSTISNRDALSRALTAIQSSGLILNEHSRVIKQSHEVVRFALGKKAVDQSIPEILKLLTISKIESRALTAVHSSGFEDVAEFALRTRLSYSSSLILSGNDIVGKYFLVEIDGENYFLVAPSGIINSPDPAKLLGDLLTGKDIDHQFLSSGTFRMNIDDANIVKSFEMNEGSGYGISDSKALLKSLNAISTAGLVFNESSYLSGNSLNIAIRILGESIANLPIPMVIEAAMKTLVSPSLPSKIDPAILGAIHRAGMSDLVEVASGKIPEPYSVSAGHPPGTMDGTYYLFRINDKNYFLMSVPNTNLLGCSAEFHLPVLEEELKKMGMKFTSLRVGTVFIKMGAWNVIEEFSMDQITNNKTMSIYPINLSIIYSLTAIRSSGLGFNGKSRLTRSALTSIRQAAGEATAKKSIPRILSILAPSAETTDVFLSKIQQPILEIIRSAEMFDVVQVARKTRSTEYLRPPYDVEGNYFLVKIYGKTYYLTSDPHGEKNARQYYDDLAKKLYKNKIHIELLSEGTFKFSLGYRYQITHFEMTENGGNAIVSGGKALHSSLMAIQSAGLSFAENAKLTGNSKNIAQAVWGTDAEKSLLHEALLDEAGLLQPLEPLKSVSPFITEIPQTRTSNRFPVLTKYYNKCRRIFRTKETEYVRNDKTATDEN